MRICLEDMRVQIKYDPILREYFIPLIYKRELSAIQGIVYCPWCAALLPKSLRDTYFDILEAEYGIDDPYDLQQEKRIPEEFKTDAWWKKRGL
jgi:hypothetical protein